MTPADMNSYPILLLHGWNLTAAKYKNFQEEFIKRDYQVISFDLPGFGQSKIPEKSLTLSDYLNFVKSYLRQKKIKKVVLIGHSFGGRIGIKLAAQYPELLSGLILTGAPGIASVPRIKILFFLLLAKVGRVIFKFPILSFFANIARKWLYRLAQATDFYHTKESMKNTFKNIVGEDLCPYLKRINIPTLLLWGEKDKIVPLKIAREMRKILKNCQLSIIPDARHSLPWTHPKIFAEEVEKFLKGLD